MLTRLSRLGEPDPGMVKMWVAWQIGHLKKRCVVAKVGQQRVWHEAEVAVTWLLLLRPGGSTIQEGIPHWMPHHTLLP